MGVKGKRQYPWPGMVAELRARPGDWRLFVEMTAVPPSVVDRIRRGHVRALRLDDGKIYARTGVVGWREGVAIADVWLRFLPTPPKDTT